MLLTVLIPAYNEIATIRNVLEASLNAIVAEGVIKEIVVVDDGSCDGTEEVLRQYAQEKKIILITHKKNSGKGASLCTGINAAKGDAIIFHDADGEYDPGDWNSLIKVLTADNADIVFGSRFLSGTGKGATIIHIMANKFLSFLTRSFTGLPVTDMETGMKLFRTGVIKSLSLSENRFGIEPEITMKAAAIVREKSLLFREVPVSYYPRSVKEGKKIGFKDGLRALYCIAKYKWSR